VEGLLSETGLESSELHRRLVREDGLAVSIDAAARGIPSVARRQRPRPRRVREVSAERTRALLSGAARYRRAGPPPARGARRPARDPQAAPQVRMDRRRPGP